MLHEKFLKRSKKVILESLHGFCLRLLGIERLVHLEVLQRSSFSEYFVQSERYETVLIAE
jgi:hypothetical protein